MPAKAKSKSKKSVKRTVKKPALRTPHIAAEQIPVSPAKRDLASPEATPSPDAQPEVVVPTTPPQPPQPAPPATPAPVPTSQPVENLEEILENDMTESEASGKNQFVFTVGIVATLALIAAAVFVFVVYLGSQKASQPVTHKVTLTPSPTPTPAFSRSTLTFEVINASGVAGAAGKVKDALMQYGYTVVGVGNGKKQTKTELFLSKNLPAAAVSAILADINAIFSVSSSSGDLVGSTASARIVLGSK